MVMRKKRINFQAPQAAMVLLCLGIVIPMVMNFVWLCINHAPPEWDDGAFLTHSLMLYDAFCERGLRGFYAQYLRTLNWKGPIVAVQAIPMFLTFGRSIRVASLINTFYMLVFSLYLYHFCRLYWNRTIAALAVVFCNLSPLLYGLANWYLRDYSYAMLMVMMAWHLVQSDGLRKTRQNVILGVLLGIAVLHRDIFPIYVFPLYVVVLMPRLKRMVSSSKVDGEWMRLAVNCATILGVAFVIAFHWYWVNFRTLFGHSFGAAFGEDSKHYGSSDIFNWKNVILPYLRQCMYALSTWHVILLLLGALGTGVALARRRVRVDELFPKMGIALIVAWCVPFIIFLFGVNKDVRFISPIVPAFGILLAILVWGAMQAGSVAKIAFGLSPVPSLLLSLSALFGMGLPAFVKNNVIVQNYFQPVKYASIYKKDYWPLREMMRYINDLHLSDQAGRTQVMTLNNSHHVNKETLQLMAGLERLPFDVTAGTDTNLERLRDWIRQMDYVVVNDGGEEDAKGLPNPGPKVFKEILKEKIFEPVDCPFRMPGGGQVRLWRHLRPQGSAIVMTEWCEKAGLARHEVKFSNVATLRWLSAACQGPNVIVRSVWAPETAFWRQYDIFTHVLGPDGKTPIINGDHALEHDRLETYQYVPGGLIYDCKVMRLADNAPKPIKVKLGLVHRGNGGRVAIASSDLPTFELQSAVLDEISFTTAPLVMKTADTQELSTQTLAASTLAYFDKQAYMSGVELKIEAQRLILVTRWRPFEDLWNSQMIYCKVFDQAGHAYSLDHALAANDSYSFYDGLSKDYVDTYSIGVQGLKSRLVRMEVGLCGKNDKVRTQIKSSRLKTVAGGTTLEIPITSPGGVALKP